MLHSVLLRRVRLGVSGFSPLGEIIVGPKKQMILKSVTGTVVFCTNRSVHRNGGCAEEIRTCDGQRESRGAKCACVRLSGKAAPALGLGSRGYDAVRVLGVADRRWLAEVHRR